MAKKFDTYELVEALMRVAYHRLSIPKEIQAHLKKTKHLNADGKPSKAGERLLESWFKSGSDRIKIAKELS